MVKRRHRLNRGRENDTFEWTPYSELLLLHSLYGLKPIGVCYHFLMIVIWEKFKKSIGIDVPLSVVKEKLSSWYNFDAAAELMGEIEFPQEDFTLPESEFPEVYSDVPRKKTRI